MNFNPSMEEPNVPQFRPPLQKRYTLDPSDAAIKRYDTIHIAGHDSQLQTKKYKIKSGVRLKLLRRTLRERSVVAKFVRELKVPNLQTDTAIFDKETIDLVATTVMACPNLERFVGMYPTYHHEFDRLTYALSTRTKLKEHAWIIGENAAITQRSLKQLPPGLMDLAQVDSFIHYHTGWANLTTLLLHSENSGVLEHDIFIEIFGLLPSLQNLHISSFDQDDFNDATLLYIPPLKSLRLENLAGVTDQGLSRFASHPSSKSLERLSLLHLPLRNLLVISKLLAHMPDLSRFMFIQETSPTIPADEFLVVQPIVASNSLEFLHWEIFSEPDPATTHVATSIRSHGFPSLRTIRAPADRNGELQMQCRPRAQLVLASDKYNTSQTNGQRPGMSRNSSYMTMTVPSSMLNTPGTATPKSPASMKSSKTSYFPKKIPSAFDAGTPDIQAPTLLSARRAAQTRIENARTTVQYKVFVNDEDGLIAQVYDFNGFIGTIGSHITYTLASDFQLGWAKYNVPGLAHALLGSSKDRAELLIEDLRRGEGEREGCTGLWNASYPAGRKWWHHRERPRWRGVPGGVAGLC
ncbi:hypothetical protein MMC25_007698 [Agyrium rufum]|nr:hypothetical protein [Agyrium rufum]